MRREPSNMTNDKRETAIFHKKTRRLCSTDILFCLYLSIFIIILSKNALSTAREAESIQAKYHFEVPLEYNRSIDLNLPNVIKPDHINVSIHNILNQLRYQGFPLASLDSLIIEDKNGTMEAAFYFTIGKRLIVNRIETRIDGIFSDTAINYLQDSHLNNNSLINASQEILDNHVNHGFPYARLKLIPDNIHFENKAVETDLQFVVDRGPFMRINKLHFPGKKYSTDRILQLESRIERGDVFSREDLLTARKTINRLEHIKKVDPPFLQPIAPGIIDVYMPVSQRQSNRVSGIAGLNPQDDDLYGEFEIEFGNILGTGRELQFLWSSLNPNDEGIRVFYREPWLFGKPLHIGAGLEMWSDDSIETTNKYFAQIDWSVNPDLIIHGKLSLERANRSYSEDDNQIIKTTWFELGGEYSQMDHLWNPKNGIKIATSTSGGLRKISNEAKSIRRDLISIEAANALLPEWIAYMTINAIDFTGRNIRRTELIEAGGTNTVRGYIEGRNLARGFAWSNTEFRWRPEESAYLGILLDYGRIYRKDSSFKPGAENLLSYGLTGAFETRAGRLKLDLALSRGSSLSNARLHVHFRSYF